MDVFLEISLIIGIATLIAFLMRLLRQPLVVGYILTGIIVGPYFLNLIASRDYIELFSKLGIAILLFIIGLSLRLDIIREVGKISIIAGLGQVIATSILGYVIMRALHFAEVPSIYAALALTFSSTIIIFKLLSDKGDLNKLYGKIAIGLLLVQDIFAAVVLLVISVFGLSSAAHGNIPLYALGLLFKGALFFALLYLTGKHILPKLSNFFARSQELLFLFSMCWGLGLAAVFYLFGFSLEIGALSAGVALASSNFSDEIGSRMKPLRDFFILLFFVFLGSQIVFPDLHSVALPAILLSLFVLIGNPIIVIVLMNLLGYKRRTAFQVGLTVAQISEFSLILMALGFSFGQVPEDVVSLITLVGIITITASTYLVQHSEKIYPAVKDFLWLFEWRKKPKHMPAEHDTRDRDMIIFGYDRVGYDFVNVAQKMNINYLVVDFNPTSIKKMERARIPHIFGDAEDAEFLDEISVARAKIVVSTIPEFKANMSLVHYYRNRNPGGIVIVISHSIKDAHELYRRGASFVVMPHYLGARFASRMIESHGLEPAGFEMEKKRHLMDLERRQHLTGEA